MNNDYSPTASWETLRFRAELLGKLRSFFASRGFLEVETPLLSADCVVDTHLDPFSVTLYDDPARPEDGPRYWLQTSPEFAMKRLLAAGATSIYQVCKAFRAAETGPLHNPEFTIVEWYRVGDDQTAGIQFLDELAQAMLQTPAAERLSYRQVFQRFLDLDPFTAELSRLQNVAIQHGFHGSADTIDRDSLLNFLLADCIEPHLGREEKPVLLHSYPVSQAALAKRSSADPQVAERFELYWRGVELANGYHELTDPQEMRSRAAENNRLRVSEGKFPIPEENRLLEAMDQGLPHCAGVALGFDRLVMLAAGVDSIDQVLAFPVRRA